MATPSRRPRGRPPVPAETRKRNNVTIRMRDELKAKVEQSADAHQRSISQEIERHLERSFDQDQRLEDVFGSADLFGLLRVVGAAMDVAGKSAAFMATRSPEASRGWIDHPDAYDQALQAAVDVLQRLRPPGKVELPDRRPPAHHPKPPGYRDMVTGREVTEEEFYRIGKERMAKDKPAVRLASRQLDSEATRANLGRLADRLDKEQEK
jgi:hypothetical protein